MKKIYIFICFSFYLVQAQEVKITGFIKQPTNERVKAFIVVNDTINKLTKLDSNNYARRDKVFREGISTTINDDKGYFAITAKPKDSLFFQFGRLYRSEKYSVSDLMNCKDIIIEPKQIPCILEKKCSEENPSKVYAFVGRKIDVSYVDTTLYCHSMMDSKYRAVYKIEQEFAEHHPNSTITFTAYDHNSRSEYDFRNYVNILVFVGEFCGDLIQFKYQFFPVYKTENGRWATPVDTFMEPYYKTDNFKPEDITFNKTLFYSFPVDLSAQQLEYRFPKKYYRIENGNAYPIMGRYVEDLVKLWKELSAKR